MDPAQQLVDDFFGYLETMASVYQDLLVEMGVLIFRRFAEPTIGLFIFVLDRDGRFVEMKSKSDGTTHLSALAPARLHMNRINELMMREFDRLLHPHLTEFSRKVRRRIIRRAGLHRVSRYQWSLQQEESYYQLDQLIKGVQANMELVFFRFRTDIVDVTINYIVFRY